MTSYNYNFISTNYVCICMFRNGKVWLGLSDSIAEGVFRLSSTASATWTSFSSDQPNGQTEENCVIIENGEWQDTMCNDTYMALCQSSLPGKLL